MVIFHPSIPFFPHTGFYGRGHLHHIFLIAGEEKPSWNLPRVCQEAQGICVGTISKPPQQEIINYTILKKLKRG